MVRGFPKEGDVVFTTEAPLGLSYLHIQTLANERDLDGTYIKSMKKD